MYRISSSASSSALSLLIQAQIFLFCFFIWSPAFAATEKPKLARPLYIYVALVGKDSNNGLYKVQKKGGHSGPVLSLERARDVARGIRRKSPNLTGPIIINIAPGLYRRQKPLLLGPLDSGTKASPTIYLSEISHEAEISGAILLSLKQWRLCPTHICISKSPISYFLLSPDLRVKSGVLFEDGYGKSNGVGRSELYFSGKKMPLSRWPNSGMATVSKVVDDKSFKFRASESAPNAAPGSLWARGYWGHGWADYSKKVNSVDLSAETLSLADSLLPYQIKKNDPFYLFNDLSLIDLRGEWSFDEGRGYIYFLPPSKSHISPEWSIAENLIVVDGASFITFSGIKFSKSRGDAIVLRESNDVNVLDCRIDGVNGWAVRLLGNRANISNCFMGQLGLGGVKVHSGDRATLSSGNVSIKNNVITNFSQRVRTYQSGVMVSGVGTEIIGNKIDDAPHSAILLSGNDHVVKGNEISHVMREASDGGAIYVGMDWLSRGIVMQGNYLHDISSEDGRAVMGMYMDDQTGGATITDNFFWNVNMPVLIGGGSDNFVARNVFVNSSPSIYMDDRGLSWQKELTQSHAGGLQKSLTAIPFRNQGIWKQRYPDFIEPQPKDYGYPRRNSYVDNTFVNSTPFELKVGSSVKKDQKIDFEDLRKMPTWIDKKSPEYEEACNIAGEILPSTRFCRPIDD